MEFPKIIQGGMGAGVSNWRLARSVAARGQIGVVSGTAIDLIMTRRLQLGDSDGHMRRGLAAFPDQRISQRILDRYFISGGKSPNEPFAAKPMVGHEPSRHLRELLVAANFVEVFLAKEGHPGAVGVNYLNKIQTPLLPSLYGAMLAGVDIVIVGAGIPIEIPNILDCLSRNEPAELNLHVRDAKDDSAHKISFDPSDLFAGDCPAVRRPLFFPIVSSVTLATLLVKKKCKRQVDGLIIESAVAGGHNAPPRDRAQLSPAGEPIYGPRDRIDLNAIRSLEVPFWLAGSYGSPEKLKDALAAGARGIQVGTLFAFCRESGIQEDLKRKFIEICRRETPRIFTDPVASPTGFPFKVLSMPNTMSDPKLYEARRRQCDLGYLREPYERPDRSLGWRCSAEDPQSYVGKGGSLDDTFGRKCLCNGLLANIGLQQAREENGQELPLLTCGDDVSGILRLLRPDVNSYSSSNVIDFLLPVHETKCA